MIIKFLILGIIMCSMFACLVKCFPSIHKTVPGFRGIFKSKPLFLSFGTNHYQRWDDMSQVQRNFTPQRNDVCKILISGIVGTDPKEAYLSNGHYVKNFALGVVGHFKPVHDWENGKPVETMWMSSEIWDDEARKHDNQLRKGSAMYGIGYLIFNKWVDKANGEERKQFKLRLTKIVPQKEFDYLTELMSDAERGPAISTSSSFGKGDSSFSDDFPSLDNQALDTPSYSSNEPDEEQFFRHHAAQAQQAQQEQQNQSAQETQLGDMVGNTAFSSNALKWSRPSSSPPAVTSAAEATPPVREQQKQVSVDGGGSFEQTLSIHQYPTWGDGPGASRDSWQQQEGEEQEEEGEEELLPWYHDS